MVAVGDVHVPFLGAPERFLDQLLAD